MEKTHDPLVSFFVPCLNEEGNIGRAIDSILEVMRHLDNPYEILVVDDASTDGSVAEIQGRCRRYPEVTIKLIQNASCRGLGSNYSLAAQQASGEYFILVCGDAAELPESILEILSHMGEAEVIVPYMRSKDTRALSRRLLSQTFTFLVNLLSGHHLHYYNGAVLHKTENVRAWFSGASGFGYQAELLCQLLSQGASVVEVQIGNSEREKGSSKAFTLRNIVSVSSTLFYIFLRRLTKKRSLRREEPALVPKQGVNDSKKERLVGVEKDSR